jgi:integrase
LEPAFGNSKLSEISPFHVEKYIPKRKSESSYRKAPISPATINRELAVLKRMFNLAVKWRKAETNPVCEVRFLKEERKPERVLSEQEEESLLSHCARREACCAVCLACRNAAGRDPQLALAGHRSEAAGFNSGQIKKRKDAVHSDQLDFVSGDFRVSEEARDGKTLRG